MTTTYPTSCKMGLTVRGDRLTTCVGSSILWRSTFMTTYDRKGFLESLSVVADALSGSDLLPIMQDFCFRDGQVIAINESTSMATPLRTDLNGCLHGKTLLKILAASRAKSLEFNVDGDNGVKVKVGG